MIGFYHGIQKKRNVIIKMSKDNPHSRDLAYCKPHPQRVPVVITFYIRSGGTENAEDRVKVDQPEEIIDLYVL